MADLDSARDILRRVFGHADFRGLQGDVIGGVTPGERWGMKTEHRRAILVL